MLKKIISFILIFSTLLSLVTPAYAYDNPDVSPEALRVSDEFAAIYPNGLLEFVSLQYDVEEDADEFDVIIARRGGTKGKVEVDFKVIEVSAKYDEDFLVLMPAWYGDKVLKKETDAPTLLELSLEGNQNNVITSSAINSEIITSSAIGYEITKEPEIEATVPVYKSSLHELRDKATGVITEKPQLQNSPLNIFEIEDPEAIKVGEALNTLMPGATGHLVFEDGENYKTIKVKVIDDELFEGPEQFTIGLYEPTNGAVLGDSFNTVVNINNNDEGQDEIIGFDSEEYYVYPGEKEAVLNIIRTGETNTYAKIEISTLSGTARAGEHYRPIVVEVMFLPGEDEKKITIPILANDASETISFKMVITEENAPVKGINRAKVYIYPGDEQQLPLKRNMRLMAAAPSRIDQEIRIYADEFTVRKYIGNNAGHQWEYGGVAESFGRAKQMNLTEGWYRLSSMYKYLDLRGIGYISWKWSNSGDSGDNNRSTVTINGNSDWINGNFDGSGQAGQGENIKINFDKTSNSLIEFKNETWWNNSGKLKVDYVDLKRQQFDIKIEANSAYYSVWDNDTRVESGKKYNPGTVRTSINNPYRDESLSLIPDINSEGRLRSANFRGYTIRMPDGNYTDLKTNNTIHFTPEFIETYIYNNGRTPNPTTLTIKPYFNDYVRTRGIYVREFDSNKGTVKIGNEEYNNKTKTFQNYVYAGDELIVNVIPKAGYKLEGIAVYRNNSPQPEIVNASLATNIVLSEQTSIEPIFEKTSKDIFIKWDKPKADGSEDYSQNIVKGMILHDKPNHMPSEEKRILNNNLPNQPLKENYPDDITYNEALSEYIQSLNNYAEQIQANYEEYRNKYNGTYNLKDIVEGDVVTLFAKPIEGYTVQWTPDYEVQGGFKDAEYMQKIQPYYGNSFTFEVTPDLKGIKYYFSSVNNSGYSIATGKVVCSKQTIKNQEFAIVNQKKPDTYDAVPNVEISVAVADGNTTKTINGVTYKTTAKTDTNGNFQIYLPNSVVDKRYSLKMMQGNRYVPTYVTGPESENSLPFMLELPFMDTQYRVYSMNITDEKEDKASNSYTVYIEDKKSEITIKTSKNEYNIVYGVKVRSYDSLGNLWDEWNLTTTDMETWKLAIPNMVEAFKDGGRLTVELFDSGMVSKGEMESGYLLEVPETPSKVDLPQAPDYGDGKVQEPFGEINPDVDLGEVRSLIPIKRSNQYGSYSIAVGTGETIKQLIEDNVQNLDTATVQEKLNILTQYIREGEFSKNLLNKDFKPNNSGNVKSGRAKGNITVNFDIGFYIQLTKLKENNQNVWYFDYTIIYIAAELKARQDFNMTISGVPVYVTLTGGGSARGLIMAEGNNSTKIKLDKYAGYFPVGGSLADIVYYGQMKINLYVGIGAGVGRRGVLSAGVSGKLDFDLGYQPWEAAKGVLTFALSVDIDVLIIPISFKVHEYTWDLFEVGNYNDNAWLPTPTGQNRMLRMANLLAQEESVVTVGELERTTPSSWNTIPSAINAGVGMIDNITLQTNIYKHPEPEIVDLNNGKKILFYINDDPSRNNNELTAIYYSIYEEDEYGGIWIWSEPILLQNDDTGDYDLNVKNLGDKIAVLWSSHENRNRFDDGAVSLDRLLGNNDIYLQMFDMDGKKQGNIERLTFDAGEYSNSSPKIAYDETTNNMMVFYKKTDYSTEGIEFDEKEAGEIGNFLNNSYSTIAYRIYDGKSQKWQTEYYENEVSYKEYEKEYGEGILHGQRFMDFNMPDPVKVDEYAVVSHNDKILITYVHDVDQDINTKDDTDLFAMIYDFALGKFTQPIRITNDNTPDMNPKEIEFGDNIYLFWNNDGYISYVDLDAIMEYGLKKAEIDEDTYYQIDEKYNYFSNVMEEQNYEAAESFSLTAGKDGNLYVVWNEYELSLPKNADSTDDAVKSRQMYIAMYDAKYNLAASYLDESNNKQDVYKGAWGSKWQLTETLGESNNEQTVSVGEDGTIAIANRKYNIVSDEESQSSSLVVRTYKPISTLSITGNDIETYPQYPRSGEQVRITVNATNYGFMPSEKVTFKFEMLGSDGFVQIGENQEILSHLSSGKNISANTYFTMPDEISDVTIRITAWEEELTDSSPEIQYVVNTDDDLKVENLKAYYYDEDSINIRANIVNSGNLDGENVKFVIENFDYEFIKKVDIGSLKVSDIYTIDELIDVDPSYINDEGEIILRVKVVETKNNKTDVAAFKDNIIISKAEDMDLEISDIVINNNFDVRIKMGETKNINARIIPFVVNNVNRLQYSSLTPDIAEIDPSSGIIYAKKPGSAEILVEAVSLDNSFFLAGDGLLYDAEGNIAQFTEDGTVISKNYENTGVIKASKNIFVNVTEKGTDENDDDDDDKKTTDITKGKDSVVIQIGDSSLNKKSVIAALNELKKTAQTEKRLQIVSSSNSVVLEREAAELINSSNVNTEISLNGGSLFINQDALSNIISSSQGDIDISLIRTETAEGRPVVDINITSDNEAITDFGGNEIIVAIPYILKPDENANAIVVYYVDSNGAYHMATGQYNNGMVTFKTNHLSKFEVGYNLVKFEDVTGWAEDYSTYLSARKIINGAGNNKFLPQNNITRAEFVKMLAVLSSDRIPNELKSNYTDVYSDDWYAPYIAWAAKKGYILGMSETIFAPNENITREQMAVIINRFIADRNIKLYNSEAKLFDDASDISTYAKDAVNVLSRADIISGKGNNKFEPKQNATRAESSKMLTMLLKQYLN